MQITFRGKTIDCSEPHIVGILNVTPDSYVDGGQYITEEKALKRARECYEEGAMIVEVGGESTGPNSQDITEEEELERVLPVVRSIRRAFPDRWISVDTWKASIAEAALEAGADMINDITAGRGNPRMFELIAKHGCPYALMYSKDSSARTTKQEKEYTDVLGTIHTFLEERIALAKRAGISSSQIIIDPGLGHFVSSIPSYSFHILEHLEYFKDLAPIFISPSRKSFLAGPENLPVDKRLPATLVATQTALQHGASFIRTHDVLATKQVIDAVR